MEDNFDKELDLEDLQNINASPDNRANYYSAVGNEDLYRKKQIEELKALKKEILGKEYSEEETSQHTR